jgi:hypothetical protein
MQDSDHGSLPGPDAATGPSGMGQSRLYKIAHIWTLVTVMGGNTMPPREPTDDGDEDAEDEQDEDRQEEPAVVREPDE